MRAKNINPVTHTRLPRYVRGHVGVVELDHGCQVFPDSAATGAGENPQWLYTVVFDAANCGATTPIRREGLDRRVRAVSGEGLALSVIARESGRPVDTGELVRHEPHTHRIQRVWMPRFRGDDTRRA